MVQTITIRVHYNQCNCYISKWHFIPQMSLLCNRGKLTKMAVYTNTELFLLKPGKKTKKKAQKLEKQIKIQNADCVTIIRV